MAINFLNTVDLNSIQIENIVPENLTVGTRGAGVLGQMYFDTGEDTMMQFVADSDGLGNPGYVEIGSTSAVETFTNASGTYVAFGTNNTSAIGDVTVGTVDLTAVDGTSNLTTRFLSKDNTWDVPAFDNYSGWTLNGQSGTPQVISSGDTALFTGGTKITTSVAGTDTLTITHDATSRTDTTSTVTANAFSVVNTVSTDSTGHVTAIDVKTVTVTDTNTTYSLPVTAGVVSPGTPTTGIITLTGSNPSSTDPVTFVGTTNRISISGNAGLSTINVDLTDDVTIVGELTVAGTGESSFAGNLNMSTKKLLNVDNGTAATDGVNLGQVEALVAGIGLFKGGYNAATGLTINLTPNGSLDGVNNIALDQGDFFVVTADGTAFFSIVLEVGDMIYVNKTGGIVANSNPPASDYTVVIQDANIAGSGATDAATEKGVAGFDSASFDVSASGWVQLNSQRNPYGQKLTLNELGNTTPPGGPVSRQFLNGLTTFTIDLTQSLAGNPVWKVFGTGTLAENVAVEVTRNVAPFQTVYADVTRSGSGSMSVIFSGNIAKDLFRVLLTHI